MNSWTRQRQVDGGPSLYLKLETASDALTALSLKRLIEPANLPSFTRATQEVIDSFGFERFSLVGQTADETIRWRLEKSNAHYYFNNFAYQKLSFFTGRNYYGPSYELTVGDTWLDCENDGFSDDSSEHQEVQRLLQQLLLTPRLCVINWRLFQGSNDWGRWDELISGDHQSLLDYLELGDTSRIPL